MTSQGCAGFLVKSEFAVPFFEVIGLALIKIMAAPWTTAPAVFALY
jgi:hypothetical protein